MMAAGKVFFSSRFAAAGLAVGAAILAGCSTIKVEGKVIRGPRTTATVVQQNAERLTEPGVAGVSFQVAGGSFSETVVSDEEGEFSFRAPMAETDRVTVVVAGQEVSPGQARVYLPRTAQALLVVVDGAPPPAEPDEDPEEEGGG